MSSYTNLTAWNEHGRYVWADLNAGPKYGTFASFQDATDAARRATDKPDLLLYGSCPDRFCAPHIPAPSCFTQEMAETYGDAI